MGIRHPSPTFPARIFIGDSDMTSLANASGFTGTLGPFTPRALHTVLIANRGEIALRLLRCARALNLKVITVYTQEDEGAPHRSQADESVLLHGKEVDGKGYLDMDAIVEAARANGAQAVMPGYGFLSERAAFAEKVESAGMVFVGPTAESIAQLGLKHRARQLAQQADVPCVPGSDLVNDVQEAQQAAQLVGYPIMLKASAGGGGMGLQICRSDAELERAFESNAARSKALFDAADCFVEKYIERGHHIEIQIFGNGQGDVVHFGERECSIQRRHQKVIEEAPSPFVERHEGLRERMATCAKSFGHLTKYRSAGTLEFLVDDDTAQFYFLECNTRIQVEHCVTEEVWDVDIVALMLQQADAQLGGLAGMSKEDLERYEKADPPKPTVWAIEARLYCENALRNYDPSPGLLQQIDWKAERGKHRIESWVKTGDSITSSYDPLLAKLIGRGPSRNEATANLVNLLRESHVYGPTNIDFLASILDSQQFASGVTLTSFLNTSVSSFEYAPAAIEILDQGMSTSVQDGGRRGVGHGLPPSGPADLLSFRIANALVCNKENTEALEVTFSGPTIKFHCEAVVALVGAPFEVSFKRDERSEAESLRMATSYRLPVNSILRIGMRNGHGGRAYLAIHGGFPAIPLYLTSKSTSAALGLGGHQGRDLRMGDVLFIERSAAGKGQVYAPEPLISLPDPLHHATDEALQSSPEKPIPLFCMRGPFDDDVYITEKGRAALYGKSMAVSQNAARSGIRLDCERMSWARKDGGQGGSHPSNVLEFGYPLNGLNWNGDTPVLLGVEGPDLGGLLISTTLVSGEWRVGQLMPGMHIVFCPITYAQALALRQREDVFVNAIRAAANGQGSIEHITPLDMMFDDLLGHANVGSPILKQIGAKSGSPAVTMRAAGDQNLLIELGELNADLVVRSRVELLLRAISDKKKEGVMYIDVNIRTLTIRYDPSILHVDDLITFFTDVEAQLPHDTTTVKIPYRIWRMPLAFDHPAVAASVDRYKSTVRNKAVYLDEEQGTDNRGYLARTNGLSSIAEVEEAILASSLITVGNGFFLGTPIQLARDRRRRLRCQKYNPTRLQTPEGAFGWGGCMGAVYGVTSPGGYQLVARTLPFWSTFGQANGFTPQRPWLLESFDTVDFYQVKPVELDVMLATFKAGSWKWDVREGEFDVAEQAEFDRSIAKEAEEYEAKQAIAIKRCEEEEEKLFAEWRAEQDEAARVKRERDAAGNQGEDEDAWKKDPEAIKLVAPLAASVWKGAQVGKTYEEDESVIVLEAMKTEVPIKAMQKLKVTHVVIQPGSSCQPGDVLAAAKAIR